jgi:undecaprenyl-diphosphatase
MDIILSADKTLFLFLNHLPHNFPTNWMALMLSGAGTAGIVWFVLGILLILKEEEKDHWFIFPIFFATGLSLIISEILTKAFFARVRPTPDMGAIIVGVQNTDPSFPSTHATVAFAMAALLSYKEPKLKWFFYALAAFISFSRIYLGRHYPLDVIAGGFIGFCIGKLTVSFFYQKPISQTRVKKGQPR